MTLGCCPATCDSIIAPLAGSENGRGARAVRRETKPAMPMDRHHGESGLARISVRILTAWVHQQSIDS